jgi:hypothetical protein
MLCYVRSAGNYHLLIQNVIRRTAEKANFGFELAKEKCDNLKYQVDISGSTRKFEVVSPKDRADDFFR